MIKICGLSTLSLLCFAATAFAADPAPAGKPSPAEAEQAAMMAAWQAYMTPGTEHELLKKMAGSWTVVSRMWMDPKAPPMESTGKSEAKLAYGDRYLEEVHTGTMMGQPFEGRMLLGFNNAAKKYQSTWADNMGTGIMLAEGTMDKSGKVLTMVTESVDPMTKKKVKSKLITRMESDTQHVFEMYETRKGKEIKTMEMVYTKKS